MNTWRKDIPASIAVFLVALPLCLGIALASGAPLLSGLVAGIVGGIVVGTLSGSHMSVSGPAAGLVAIVLVAVSDLGSYELFLVAVMVAGVLQLGLAAVRAGRIAHYIPSSVIRGLLAAIGAILILKQIPHAFGYDSNAEGDFSFFQTDGENTFSELLRLISTFEVGAIIIAIACFAIYWGWGRFKKLQNVIPVQLAVVVAGVVINALFGFTETDFWLEGSHRVSLPDFDGPAGFFSTLPTPNLSALSDARVYTVALTLALVASLETLLNLEAADRLDKHARISPPNRELFAQGIGNIFSGALGGLPVTSVVVRSSVNSYSGAETKMSAIFHGVWLLAAVLLIPGVLTMIPLSALAVILIVTGGKLVSPAIFRDMWSRGWSQFLPFIFTVVAIVFTDLLIGVLIGLAIGMASVIRNLVSTPFLASREAEPRVGHPARIKFSQQLTFLHRAHMIDVFEEVPPGSELILDASNTRYIDPDVLDVIRKFRDVQSKERDIKLSLVGFRDPAQIAEQIDYVDVFTQDRQESLSPHEVLDILRAGNQRFVEGTPLERDLQRQVQLTSETQHPIAAVLACIDSRVPTEILFDKGLGDIFSVRLAGNVLTEEAIASLEYATEVAKAQVVVVLGHTGCGAIKAACDGFEMGHITKLLAHIEPVIDEVERTHSHLERSSAAFYREVSSSNVLHVVAKLFESSPIMRERVEKGQLVIVGGLYEISTGEVDFYEEGTQRPAQPGVSNAS